MAVTYGQYSFDVNIQGRQEGDIVKVIAQRGVQEYYEITIDDSNPNQASFSNLSEGDWSIKLDAKGYIYPPSQIINIPSENSTTIIVELFGENEFSYEWNDDSSDGGHAQQSFINEPLKIIFLEDTIAIPESFSSHELAQKYGVILDDSEEPWSDETAFKFLSNIDRLPFTEKHWSIAVTDEFKYIVKLTNESLQNDIEIQDISDVKHVRISQDAFTYAAPQIVIIDELRGSFFSKRLYNACLRLYTDNGINVNAISTVAQTMFGISFLVPSQQLFDIIQEDISNFQAFSPEEKILILTMLGELPQGMQKQTGLQYLIRRINGQPHPTHPLAAAIAWTSLNTIEFMETAFTSESVESMQRLIIHEKSHFLWEYTFDEELKDDWIEIGEWFEDPNSESGWSTTNTTEFVSPYAHAINPNEDMAESIAFYVQNPEQLQSVSIEKYNFIKQYIMHGVHYEAIIPEDLTFQVYNLYPDYYYPGRIIGSQIDITGAPEEDKTVQITIKLKTSNVDLDGGKKAYLRFYSTVGTHIDMWINSQNGGMDSILTNTFTLSKHLKAGHWFLSTIKVYDQVNNIRYGNPATVGMNLYLNNSLEDITPPVYQENSTTLSNVTEKFKYRSGKIFEDGDLYNALKVNLSYYDDSPLKRMLARMSFSLDDNSLGSPFSQDIQDIILDNGYNSIKNLDLHFPIPDYYPTGNYFIAFSLAEDLAENTSSCFYVDDLDAFNANNYNIFEDERIEFSVTTLHPDYHAPILDLNNIIIEATPTNPDAPNGETLVQLSVSIRDTSDYIGFESGIRDINYTLKNPQGQEFTYSAAQQLRLEYPNFEKLLKSPFPTGDWKTFDLSTILPVGSAPGTWGLSSIQLRDRANNIQNYSFVEIVQFDLIEADYEFSIDPTVNVNNNNIVTAINEDNSKLNVACSPCDGILFNYKIFSEYGGAISTGSGVMSNDTGLISDINLEDYPDGILYLNVTFANQQNELIAAVTEELTKHKLELQIRAYLSGALSNNGSQTDSQGRPLMRDNLRVSPYTDENYLPTQDPYTTNTNPFTNITNSFPKKGPHLLDGNQSITDSEQVFGVSGENAIVDWVYVELRSKEDYHISIASRSALIQRDGDIVDLDGVSLLQFQGITADSFYVVVNHRLHLASMSKLVSADAIIDFTLLDTETFDLGLNNDYGVDYSGLAQKTTNLNVKALWNGDNDCNGIIKYAAPDDDFTTIFHEVLFSSPDYSANYNGTLGYFQGDLNMDSRVKFTNPNDDLNTLFSQVLSYPLNVNYFVNSILLIEQVPLRSN